MTAKMTPGHGTCVRLEDPESGLDFSWTGKCPILGVGVFGDSFIYLRCESHRAIVVFRDKNDARWTYEEHVSGAGLMPCYEVRFLIERATERFLETRPALDLDQGEHSAETECHRLTSESGDRTRLTYRPAG